MYVSCRLGHSPFLIIIVSTDIHHTLLYRDIHIYITHTVIHCKKFDYIYANDLIYSSYKIKYSF